MYHTIVIPTLNEEENLRILLPKLIRDDRTVIVCDNSSSDKTVQVATSYGAIVSHGTGSVADAVFRGLKLAEPGPVVVMDADGSHPPEVVDDAVEGLLGDKDIVVMSRYMLGGKSYDTLKNRIISRVGNLLCWGLCPSVKDRMSGFFCVRKGSVLVDFSVARKTTKPMLELLIRNDTYLNEHWSEVPFIFKPREVGESKLGRGMSLPKTLYDVLLLYTYRYRKILKFLVVGGIGIGINLGLLAFFTEVAGIFYILSSAIGIFVATVWNFILNNLWTFGDRSLKGAWEDKGNWSK